LTVNRLVLLNVVLAFPPFDDRQVAPYPLIGAPLSAGGVTDTRRAWPAILEAAIALGAGGAPMTIGAVDTDAGPIPPPFAAATVNVTVAPSVSP
jgi:hypothetical protein